MWSLESTSIDHETNHLLPTSFQHVYSWVGSFTWRECWGNTDTPALVWVHLGHFYHVSFLLVPFSFSIYSLSAVQRSAEFWFHLDFPHSLVTESLLSKQKEQSRHFNICVKCLSHSPNTASKETFTDSLASSRSTMLDQISSGRPNYSWIIKSTLQAVGWTTHVDLRSYTQVFSPLSVTNWDIDKTKRLWVGSTQLLCFLFLDWSRGRLVLPPPSPLS